MKCSMTSPMQVRPQPIISPLFSWIIAELIGYTLKKLGTVGVHGSEGCFCFLSSFQFSPKASPNNGTDKQPKRARIQLCMNSSVSRRIQRQTYVLRLPNGKIKSCCRSRARIKSKSMSKFDDTLDGGHHDVNESTRCAADDDANEYFYEQ